MKFSRIIATILCISLTMMSFTGCDNTKSQSAGASNKSQESDAANNDSTVSDTINGWKKNSDEEYNRRMQALYAALLPMWNNEGEYSSKWDLTSFYLDEKSFMDDYEDVMSWIGTLGKFEGKLNNKESVNAYFRAVEDESMNEKYNTMLLYCELGEALDLKDTYYSDLNDKLKDLENDFAKATSYAQPEIMEIPYEQRLEIFTDPIFEDMSYYLKYYTTEDAQSFSKEEKEKAADMAKRQGEGLEAYEKYRYSDFPAAMFTLPDGQEIELTSDAYTSIIQGPYDRQTKVDAYTAYEENFEKLADDFAGFLQTSVEEKWEEAKLYGYDTTLEMALDEEQLSDEVFTNVLKAANEAAPSYAKYIKLHKDALSIEEQYMFDLDTSVSDIPKPIFPFDDTINLVKKSTAVLGEDYVAVLDEIVGGNYIDSSQGENRKGSSFCMGAGKKNMPHIFTNFYGEYTDASNLSHELGHAVNYRFTEENQPIWYSDVSIFDTEICSVLHEILFNAYLVENADSDEKKLFYLEKLLDIYDSALFSQCMYSELEDYMYKTVEGGGTLSGEDLNDKMSELFKKYRGEDIYCESSAWTCIDHLHYCYYMYKYATAICYASSLADDILGGNQETINGYKEFMKAGSSEDPLEILKMAGIDPLSYETYSQAADYYASLVDEYEQTLLRSGKIK